LKKLGHTNEMRETIVTNWKNLWGKLAQENYSFYPKPVPGKICWLIKLWID
jgi:hypothetical protein